MDKSTPIANDRDHTLAWEGFMSHVEDQPKGQATTESIVGRANGGGKSATNGEDEKGKDDDNIEEDDEAEIKQCPCLLLGPIPTC